MEKKCIIVLRKGLKYLQNQMLTFLRPSIMFKLEGETFPKHHDGMPTSLQNRRLLEVGRLLATSDQVESCTKFSRIATSTVWLCLTQHPPTHHPSTHPYSLGFSFQVGYYLDWRDSTNIHTSLFTRTVLKRRDIRRTPKSEDFECPYTFRSGQKHSLFKTLCIDRFQRNTTSAPLSQIVGRIVVLIPNRPCLWYDLHKVWTELVCWLCISDHPSPLHFILYVTHGTFWLKNIQQMDEEQLLSHIFMTTFNISIAFWHLLGEARSATMLFPVSRRKSHHFRVHFSRGL